MVNHRYKGNSTYGAMKDIFNPLYDPRSANNVCIFGQLLLTDLIERLEGHCQLIQSNTDGLIVKLHGNEDEVIAICKEWEARTGMGLGYDRMTKICQKDVNNYIAVFENGKIEAKGAYVKNLNNLDYDLAIVNKAVRDFLLNGSSVRRTVYQCQDFRMFQKVVKLSNKYKWVEHEQGLVKSETFTLNGRWKFDLSKYGATVKFDNKAYRVFASSDDNDGRLLKCKTTEKGDKKDKFANTPDKCFIFNDDLTGVEIPSKLDREWYVELAKSRLRDFGVTI